MNQYEKILAADTFTEFFSNAVSAYSDFCLFEHCRLPANCMTFRAVYTWSCNLAAYFQETFGTGKNICLTGEPDACYLAVFFAVLMSGNTVVPLDAALSAVDLRAMMRSAEAACIMLPRRTLSAVADQLDCRIIDTDAFTAGRYTDAAEAPVSPPLCADSPAVKVFTAGTTGSSKCVMLTHRNLLSNLAYCTELFPDIMQAGTDRTIPLLPTYHMLQIMVGILIPVCAGLRISFPPERTGLTECFRASPPQLLTVVPLFLTTIRKSILQKMNDGQRLYLAAAIRFSRMLRRFLHLDLRERLFRRFPALLGGNIKLIICGGAAAEQSEIDWFLELGFPVKIGYGITECSPVISANTFTHTKPESVGKPMPEYCLVRIQDGEIQVKGAGVFAGYTGEDADVGAFTEDGWFRTGDLGCLDAEGYLFITGRRKNLIILEDGNNISPEKIEAMLLRYADIQEALVYARCGEAGLYLAADIRMQPETAAPDISQRLEQIRTELNRNLPAYMRLSELHIKKEEFEKNRLGKVQRFIYVDQNGQKKEQL